MTVEQKALAEIERNGLSASLLLFAVAREVEAAAYNDAKLMAAADAIKRIDETLDQISDHVLLRWSSVNIVSEGLLSQLIMERLAQVGFALPLCANAIEFFAPIEAKVERIMQDARQHIH